MIYGGLIIITIYAVATSVVDEDYLITQSNLDILTQTSNNILVQPQ